MGSVSGVTSIYAAYDYLVSNVVEDLRCVHLVVAFHGQLET
jgi:hypothetical protein